MNANVVGGKVKTAADFAGEVSRSELDRNVPLKVILDLVLGAEPPAAFIAVEFQVASVQQPVQVNRARLHLLSALLAGHKFD